MFAVDCFFHFLVGQECPTHTSRVCRTGQYFQIRPEETPAGVDSLSDKLAPSEAEGNVRPTRAAVCRTGQYFQIRPEETRPVWIPCRTSLPRAKPRGMSDPDQPVMA